MNFKPLYDRVLVERIAQEERTSGGIIIPDSAQEKPLQGQVLAVGVGKLNDDGSIRPTDIKVGDVVLFGKYAGTEIKIDGSDRTILREDDVLGVVEE